MVDDGFNIWLMMVNGLLNGLSRAMEIPQKWIYLFLSQWFHGDTVDFLEILHQLVAIGNYKALQILGDCNGINHLSAGAGFLPSTEWRTSVE